MGPPTTEERLLGRALAPWPLLLGVVASFLACCAAEALAVTPASVQQVAQGDYVHFGQIALTTPENAGDIANLGVIVGNEDASSGHQ